MNRLPDELALLFCHAMTQGDDEKANRIWTSCSPRAQRDLATALAALAILAWNGEVTLPVIERRLIAESN